MKQTRLHIIVLLLSLLALPGWAEKELHVWNSPEFVFAEPDSALMAANPDRTYYHPMDTFRLVDFFSELDVPTSFGVAYHPSGMESVSFYAKMCLEWRIRKNYGWFAAVGLDNHSCFYRNVQMLDHFDRVAINVVSGEMWYYDLHLGFGYRVPIVKDIKEFYEHPYFNPFNFSFLVQPTATVPHTKHVKVLEASEDAVVYELDDYYNIVPSLKLTAAFEWLVTPKFAISLEACYIQHFMPTILEKGYYDYINHPQSMYAGPLIFNIGFAGFFN